MLPFITLGSWTISTYALLYTLMYLLVGIYGYLRLRRLPYSHGLLANAMLATILAVFCGSLLPVFFSTLESYVQSGTWLWHGQVRLLWGMALGIGTAVLYLRVHRLPPGKIIDRGVVPFPLGMAIGRLGCFAAGCCYGAPTDSWPGMYLRDSSGAWYNRYPTQLMCAAADLLIFLVLLQVERWNTRRPRSGRGPAPLPDGSLLLLFVLLYGFKRFFIEFLRYDYAPILGPLDVTQLVCLAGLLGAFLIFAWRTAAQRTAAA